MNSSSFGTLCDYLSFKLRDYNVPQLYNSVILFLDQKQCFIVPHFGGSAIMFLPLSKSVSPGWQLSAEPRAGKQVLASWARSWERYGEPSASPWCEPTPTA